MHWRRKWQPTPVFLPGESQGQRSLVGCHPWGRTELDTTEVTYSGSSSIPVVKVLDKHLEVDFALMFWDWVRETIYLLSSYKWNKVLRTNLWKICPITLSSSSSWDTEIHSKHEWKIITKAHSNIIEFHELPGLSSPEHCHVLSSRLSSVLFSSRCSPESCLCQVLHNVLCSLSVQQY